MNEKVRYGIIGCGMMGQEHLHNIALLDDAAAGAIYEPDSEMCAEAARIAPGAKISGSLDELLRDASLDCLLVASPNFLHVEQLKQIADARPLPLLVEKPLFTDPDHREELLRFERNYPAPVWVAMEYRFMPPIAAFLEQVEDATGGIRMLTIREHRFPFLHKVGHWNRFNRYTGGTFVEKCCHFFDLMRRAIGDEPVRIMASAAQDVNHLEERYGDETPDILDNGYVIVDFDNGARALVELCMFADGSRFQEELTAVGAAGKIEARVPGPNRFWPEDLGDPPVSELEISPRAPIRPRRVNVPVEARLLAAGSHNGSTFYQHERFLKLVRGEIDAPDVSLRDGRMAVEMGFAAQRSAMTGEVVVLDLD